MITLAQYIGKNRDVKPQVLEDATDLVDRVNLILAEPGCPIKKPVMTSGLRSQLDNARVGGAKSSRHLTGEAIDISDPNGEMGKWLLANQDLLVKHGLWCEHPEATKGKNGNSWVHYQNTPPRSGNRFYFP